MTHGDLRLCSREHHPKDSLINVGGVALGGGGFCLIAGPCAVESAAQMEKLAPCLKASGAAILRGGAFKPRTSPYSFQGLEEEGIAILSGVGKKYGLPVVSEILDAAQLPLFADIDMIQVGARNMQNFTLLKALGQADKPVFLKRGMGNTIDELLWSAEYLMAEGNQNIVLCERGIRTFEHRTRSTLDISAVPLLKKLTHLPVFVDPSHASGDAALVPDLALAAVAAGADGVMLEVHDDPPHALSDGAQSLTPQAFAALCRRLQRLASLKGEWD